MSWLKEAFKEDYLTQVSFIVLFRAWIEDGQRKKRETLRSYLLLFKIVLINSTAVASQSNTLIVRVLDQWSCHNCCDKCHSHLSFYCSSQLGRKQDARGFCFIIDQLYTVVKAQNTIGVAVWRRRGSLCLTPTVRNCELWVCHLVKLFFFQRGSSLLRYFQSAVSQMDRWNKLNLGRSHLAREPISHGCTDKLTNLLHRTQYTVYLYIILWRLWKMSSATYFTVGTHQILSVWPHMCFYSYSIRTTDSKLQSLHPLCSLMF